jgi:hypothetical protein
LVEAVNQTQQGVGRGRSHTWSGYWAGKRSQQQPGSGTVQPPIPAAGNWMAVPSRADRSPGPLMHPVEGPEGGPGERTEGGSGNSTGSGSGYCTGSGSGYCTGSGSEYCTGSGSEYCTGSGPGYCTGGHPGYRTPGDPGGCGRFWSIFLGMRQLGLFFRLTWSSHICKLWSPRRAWILARKTSRGTLDARRRRQDAGWLGTRAQFPDGLGTQSRFLGGIGLCPAPVTGRFVRLRRCRPSRPGRRASG